MTPSPPYLWRVDSADRLRDWNEAFVEFARMNGAPELPGRLAGTSIYDHISGAELRELHRLLLGAARRGARVSVPFSCDGPAERRFFNLQLAADAGGGVSYESRMVATAPKAPGLPRLELIKVCSWCGRLEDDGWHPPERVIERRGLLIESVAPRCTHGICPDCYARVSGDFAAPLT